MPNALPSVEPAPGDGEAERAPEHDGAGLYRSALAGKEAALLAQLTGADAGKSLLLKHPDLFILRYFPHKIEALEAFHLRLIEAATTRTRSLILFPAAHGKPGDGESLVLMADGSQKMLREVEVGDRVISGEGKPDVVTAVYPQGELPCFRISTANGREVVAAKDHRFLTPTGFREVQDLRAGMALGNVSSPETEPTETERSEEEYRLAGYFVGDGSCKQYGSALASNITAVEEELREDIACCAERMGFRAARTARRVSLAGGARDWLRSVGLAGHGSYTKRVPDFVFRSPAEKVAHFLGAYFACDGNVNQSHKARRDACCEFYSVNKQLLADVQHLLLRFGIQTHLRLKNGRYRGERHISWRLSITSQDDVARFAERIPIPGRKADLLREWAYERGRFDERVLSDPIVSVEEAGERDCYCITVERDKTYTLADLVTHNTTLISTLLPIWALCKNPNVRVSIIARNDQDAKSIMRAIQAELLANDDLIEDFGPFREEENDNKPWALEKLTITACNRRDPRATIEVFGSGANILGKRSDWVICDDVVTERNSATPEQRQKMREWFNLGVETMPEFPDSRLTVVGTLFDPEDLYNDIMELVHPTLEEDGGDPIYHVQREDAIVDEESHETLWPSRWPFKRLIEQKAKMGTLDFNKRYRNIAVDKSRMVFREEYVKGGYIGKIRYPGCLDKNYSAGDYDQTWRRAAGFDPAVGTGRSSKFCAHIVLASGTCQEHERCYWVVDLARDQMTLPQQVDLILREHERYDLFTSRVEANSYQAGLYQSVVQKMNELGTAYRIEPHVTTKENKHSSEVGVQSMSRWFEDGKIHIPWSDPASQRRMQQLVDELVQYPGRTTDTVLAFWFAWKALEESAPRFSSFNRLSKPMAWQRTKTRRTFKNPYYEKR